MVKAFFNAQPNQPLLKRQPARRAPIQIVVADDHPIVRSGIVANLMQQRDERRIKSPSNHYLLSPNDRAPDADVSGLSCRWEPLRSAHGEMLTLLVQSRATGGEADRYYQQFYVRLRELTGLPDEKLNPVKVSALRTGWPPKDLSIETRTHAGHGKLLSRFFAATCTLLHSLGGAIVFNTGLPIGWLNPKRYKNSTVMRSDFRKFDGLLRMVLDVPAILEFLETEHRCGAIFYGTHRSDSALMTCIIFSVRRDSHVHFIDGNDGGYALASLQFKQQIKAAGC